ncbi:hypothetical protein ACOSP7_032295 [Xanthoceras sorbifolium]
MSMAAESSSTIQRLEYIMATLPASSLLIVKSMNFNLSIKLNRDNYIYWKALVMPNIRAIESAGQAMSDQDLLLNVLNGLDHEYDPVAVLVSQQSGVTLHEAQYMLMIHEQRIEHLNSTVYVDISLSVNFVNNNGGI